MAGMVTPTPKAMDSPALPVVCTMLCSRMLASRTRNFDSRRNSVMEITATGIEALTVRPDLQHQIERRGAEDDAEDGADDDRAQRHLGQPRVGRDDTACAATARFCIARAYRRRTRSTPSRAMGWLTGRWW